MNTADSGREKTNDIADKTTTDYIREGQTFSIKRRLEDLMNGNNESRTEFQKGFSGANIFFSKDFNGVKFPYPEVKMDQILQFFREVFSYTHGIDGSESKPLILDPILNALIAEMGDSFEEPRLIEIMRIANKIAEPEMSFALSCAIFSYLRNWDTTSQNRNLSKFENELNNLIDREEDLSPNVLKMISNFKFMIFHYGWAD